MVDISVFLCLLLLNLYILVSLDRVAADSDDLMVFSLLLVKRLNEITFFLFLFMHLINNLPKLNGTILYSTYKLMRLPEVLRV